MYELGKSADGWKQWIGPVMVGIIMALMILVVGPKIHSDNVKADNKAFADQGCNLYANDSIDDVPAKCQNYFRNQYETQPKNTKN